ncbi:uncharacterized protein LOC113233915 [Hyposmocoma kahamanoa]|uniref:uncharacterized protein LOC113233915 n=1 Tax=Hyposmocoma kahamanoa TaxID=1477025 RepID=UPI000E6D6E34|nr:uncharacterized protein LOC113233915 [Hyposmocoma kahamanoa]
MLAPSTSATPRPVMSSSKTTTLSSTITTPSSKTITPSLAEKPVQYKQQKLIIPIIKPITYTEWATFPGVVAVTDKSLKFTGRFNEDFQKPFKEFVEYSITSSQTIRTIETIPPWRKIRIPVVLEPKYITVNDWNNLQRPMFAQIHQITKGSTQSTLSKIMKYYYTDGFYKAEATEPCYSKVRYLFKSRLFEKNDCN